MRRRRGLTLIEVLAAAALLAVLAAACLPVLRSAFAVLHDENDERFEIAELSVLIDQLREEPDRFGLTLEQVMQPQGVVHVPWPDDAERSPALATVKSSTDPEWAHAWLVLSAVDRQGLVWSVSRRIGLAKEERP